MILQIQNEIMKLAHGVKAAFGACPRAFRTALFVLGALALYSSSPTFAQATGKLTGVVSDPARHVVQRASVKITNTATGQSRTVTSGADGVYLDPLVKPGIYQVSVTAPGFKTSIAKGVQVAVDTSTHLDVRLSIGGVTEEVVATDVVPLVETQNATLGTVISGDEIVDLPLNGRNVAQLGTLIPGVSAPPSALGGASGNATVGGFGDATGSYNVNGQRNQSNNFLLDGSPNNDSFNSGFVFRPPPDAVQEFKIQTNSYEAQYGRNSGAIVDVITRSGGDQLHGDAWEFNRISGLAAKNYFQTMQPEYIQNQFGAALGGPIKRKKLFLFGYYEGFRLKDGTANNLNVPVLSKDERSGNFSVFTKQLTDPGAAYGHPVFSSPNVINPGYISPIARAILTNYIPPFNTQTPIVNANGTTSYYYKASPPNIDNRNTYGLRGDWTLNAKHAILGRYLYAHQYLFGPVTPSNFAPSGNLQLITTEDALVSDTWALNDHTINVARYGWQAIRGEPNKTSGVNLNSVGYGFSASNAEAAGLPYVAVTNYFTQGDAQQPFARRGNHVDTFSDALTWLKHNHDFQFGGEIRRDRIDLLYINRPNGNFSFGGGTSNAASYTGDYAADFLLGYPTEFQQGSGDPALDGSSWTYALYAQDEYRVTRHLVLQYGVRYEVNRPYVDDRNHLAALHPGQQSSIEPSAPLGLVYPGDAHTPRSTYDTDDNNVAPRLGLAYDPFGNGKTSVRAAWGLFYDTVTGQGDFFQNGTLAPPFQPLQEIDLNTFAGQPSSTYFANPYNGVTSGPAGFPANLTFIGYSLANTFRTPRVQQYHLGVQQQLTSKTGFEIGYVGSRGEYLPIFIEVNPTTAVSTGSTTPGTNAYKAGARAVFSQFGLTRPTFSAGKSWYDALQASWQLRGWHKLHATAAYTWSHSLDELSGLNLGEPRPVLAATIGDQSSIDAAARREKGNALFDIRNRFVASLVYQLPLLEGQPLAKRAILGGWKFDAIYQVQSGTPVTAVNSTNTAQSLTFRPNRVGNPNSGAPHQVGAGKTWFNTSAFALPTTPGGEIDNSRSGNETRGSIRGPDFTSTDVSLIKTLSMFNGHTVEFRLEGFNVFNTPHFAQPNASFGSTAFGSITSTVGGDQRLVQLGGKINF
ncbi:MAG: carboxypeptidase regulatory-like domain-containing protein [Terracidiphilus sp.]|nr:carboxypeptidase regulatory-like domain-containing protein [Terracidiphilus sp.]